MSALRPASFAVVRAWRPASVGVWRPTSVGAWRPTSVGVWRPTSVGVWRPASIAAVLGALALWGCGGIISPDLFLVQRSGASPGARLTLVVSEEGMARCNGGAPHRLSDAQLIQARTIQEKLHAYAAQHESLPPARGSVLSYYVRDADGSVRFADNSAHQPRVMREMALLVLTVARDVCRLPQDGA